MPNSIKMLACVASLLCTTATFALAISPALHAAPVQSTAAKVCPDLYAANTHVSMYELAE